MNTSITDKKQSWMRRLIALAGVVVLAPALVACTDMNEPPADPGVENGADGDDGMDDGGDPNAEPVTPYDEIFVIEDFYGEEVTLSGKVNAVIPEQAFSMGDVAVVAPLLVVGDTRTTFVSEGDTVLVTGIIYPTFVLVDVEAELDVDLIDALFADWEGQPYMIATLIEVT